MRTELTDREVEQIEKIQGIAYSAMVDLLDDLSIPDDPDWIDRIADALTEVAVNDFGRNRMDIYPYREE